MASSSYKLELDAPKRNVFVTQLNERDEDEDELAAFPIVKESAGKLLETGLSTLQKTLLLKKEVEVDSVSLELQAKREEFKIRMEKCAQKQVEIQKKQQKMKDRVSKFEKFIKENEGKRRRAIQKYQTEVKLKEQKMIELELLLVQLAELKQKQDRLRRRLANNKKYEEYLLRVVEILPAHYLEVNDNMLTSLMMRHRTLADTNITLVENLTDVQDEYEKLKLEHDTLKDEHNKMKLDINSQFSQKQNMQESTSDQNQEMEIKFTINKVEFRGKRTVFGTVVMAIDNLSEKCRRKLDTPFEDMDIEQKLKLIERHTLDRTDVLNMASSGSFNVSTDKKSTKGKTHKSALKSKGTEN